jgi:hypothetical protein
MVSCIDIDLDIDVEINFNININIEICIVLLRMLVFSEGRMFMLDYTSSDRLPKQQQEQQQQSTRHKAQGNS